MESTTEVSDGIPLGLSTCLTWFFIYSFCIQANTVLIQERQFVLSACFWGRKQSVSSECGPTGKNQTTYSSRTTRSTGVQTSALQTMVQLTGKREMLTVRLSHNQLKKSSFFTPWSFTIRSCKSKTKTKRACNTTSTQDMTTYVFLIYIPLVLGSFIIFNYIKLLPKLPWRSMSEYHCWNCRSGPIFQNCQQNERSKHRKVATYGTNQAEGVQEARRTFSPQQRQTRLRTVRPQCASGEPQIRRNHSQPRQESRAESAQPPQHCPRAVSDSAGAGCSLHTEAGHRVWDSEPVSQIWNSELIRCKGRGNDGTSHVVFWGSSFTVMV